MESHRTLPLGREDLEHEMELADVLSVHNEVVVG